MKCTKCGAECREGVKFCTQCGAPLEEEARKAQADMGEKKEELVTEPPVGQSGEDPSDPSDQPGQSGADQSGDQSGADQSEWSIAGQPHEPALEQPISEQPHEPAPEQPVSYQSAGAQPAQPIPGDSKPNWKFLKIFIPVLVIVVIVAAIAALAYGKLNSKDPKKVVINAFEGIYPKNAVSPIEELFGPKEFADAERKSDRESGMTIKLESCSDPTVNTFAGSGLRLEDKEDKTNNKSSMNMGLIYNGMDLANLNMYYGDDTLMMSVPELSTKVFTLNLGEGLADRLKNSPTVGPYLAENNINVDDLTDYLNQLTAQSSTSGGDAGASFDMKALFDRYKKGCKAQDDFKAAMTVTKADQASYTMNGKEVKCQGYDVLISKDSMIDFLRTSSDFFLQDETLKDAYLKQLETTVKMSELMSGTMSGIDHMSPEEMQNKTYSQIKEGVDEMITYLDQSLTDMKMTVYVDKKGNLAAVDGSTSLQMEDDSDSDSDNVDVTFHFELQGGAYPTQNVKGSLVLKNDGEEMEVNLLKEGTYDGKKLTSGLSLDATIPDSGIYQFKSTGSYDSKDGSYQLSANVNGEGCQLVKIAVSGVVDDLEKGKTFHTDIDSLKVSLVDNSMNMVASGELYSRPLSGEVEPPKGTTMDALAATQDDWQNVLVEMVFSGMGLVKQLGIPLN